MKKATFATGCFWCAQPPFEELKGVVSVVVGYTGGDLENPTYEHHTGHREAVQVTYDEKQISYQQLLDLFWHNIDPTDPGGQFHDRGSQYATAIYYHDDEQKTLALQSKKELEQSKKFDKKIVTELFPAKQFYPAEEYHQSYAKKNPVHYNLYKHGSGRVSFFKKMWGR